MIVVEGDLIINRNITYETSVSYSNLRNIPSLVWIVRGDLKISPDVTDLAGTFIILGNISGPASCNPVAATCGQIVTCEGGVNCDANSLTISGNVLAKYFDLGRTWTNASEDPSELFINDGRLQANPPFGFEDFSNIIPRFTEN